MSKTIDPAQILFADEYQNWQADSLQMEENFCKNFDPAYQRQVTCDICFANTIEKKIINCGVNKHKFCKKCVIRYFEAGLKDISVLRMDLKSGLPACPLVTDDCDHASCGLMSEQDYHNNEILPKPLREKYETFSFKKTLEKSFIIEQCRSKSCLQWIILDKICQETYADITCPYCNYTFCKLCDRSSHAPYSCGEYEKSLEFTRQLASVLSRFCGSSKYRETESKHDFENLDEYVDYRLKAHKIANKLEYIDKEEAEYYNLIKDLVLKVDEIYEQLPGITIARNDKNKAAMHLFLEISDSKFFKRNNEKSLPMLRLQPKNLNIRELSRYMDQNLEQLNLDYIRKICRACPYCLNPIIKNGGCDSMYCHNCRNYFNFGKDFVKPEMISIEEYRRIDTSTKDKSHVLEKARVGTNKHRYFKRNFSSKKKLPSEKRRVKQDRYTRKNIRAAGDLWFS